MSSSARRLHPRLPIFALTRGDRAVIYTPGHVAAVHRRELPGVAAALDGTDDGALEGMDWLRVVVDRARRSREAWQRWPAAGGVCPGVASEVRTALSCPRVRQRERHHVRAREH